MRGKTDLYELIHSLSKSEKRYFTLDAQKSGKRNSRYLELFKAINKQVEYDEDALKKRFDSQLADDKARLYEAILRSMRDYRSAKSYTARIKEMLMDADFLFERGLYDQCEDRLQQAKALAYELGDNLAVLEVNKEQRRWWKGILRKGYDEEVRRLIDEKDAYQQFLVEELHFLDIHDQLLLQVIKNPQRLPAPQQEDLKTHYYPLLAGEEPKSVQGRLRFHQARAFYYQLLGDQERVYTHFQAVVDTWNQNPLYKSEEFYLYIIDAANLIHAAFSNLSKYKDTIPTLLNSLATEEPHSFHDKKMLFQKVAVYRLLYHINTGEFQDIDAMLKEIDQGLDEYELLPGIELGILFNGAILLFLSERMLQCTFWIQKIIDRGRNTNLRVDIQNDVRILQLLTAYELEDVDYFDSVTRGSVRYFAQRPDSNTKRFFDKILPAIRKAFYSAGEIEQEYLATLEEALRAMEGRATSGMDELVTIWLRSRESRQPMEFLIQGTGG